VEVSLIRLNSEKGRVEGLGQYLDFMRKKYSVVENAYGYRDKRAIKEKRHLASTLLKYGSIGEATEEL